MRSKHPEAPLPVLPPGPLPDAVRFDKELVRNGLCCRASGTRPQFLKDILSCPNKAAGEDALTSLTNLTNHLVAGLAPRELAPFVAGAPLMALVKEEDSDQSPSEKPFVVLSQSVVVRLLWKMQK